LYRMAILLLIAIIGGGLLSWLIFPTPEIICLSPLLKNLTLFVCISGGFLGYLITNVSFYFNNKSLRNYLFCFLNRTIWFLPFLSTTNLVAVPLKLGVTVTKRFDQGWSEFFGGQQIYKIISYFSVFVQFLQRNRLKIYLISFVFWVIFLVCFIFF
jgi:NADH-ubiquinone oxidoreductase chain 5